MKKMLIVICAAALAVACSGNSNTKTSSGYKTAKSKNAKYQIIDQEFDNLLAPDSDYDTLPAYELQACGDSYLPPADENIKGATKPAVKKTSKKTAKKATAKESSSSSSSKVTQSKKVINNTNIYYLDANDPIPSASQTTTTTYTSEEVTPDIY